MYESAALEPPSGTVLLISMDGLLEACSDTLLA